MKAFKLDTSTIVDFGRTELYENQDMNLTVCPSKDACISLPDGLTVLLPESTAWTGYTTREYNLKGGKSYSICASTNANVGIDLGLDSQNVTILDHSNPTLVYDEEMCRQLDIDKQASDDILYNMFMTNTLNVCISSLEKQVTSTRCNATFTLEAGPLEQKKDSELDLDDTVTTNTGPAVEESSDEE
jgi:hypothetical protein